MKYVLTEEKHPVYDAFKIIASEDNEELGVKSGDFGGYIGSKDNLDEDGNSWVYPECVVFGNSRVTGNTVIKDGAILKNVLIGLNSSVSGITLSDIMISTDIKLYGKKDSIVICDKNLKFNTMTATMFSGKVENIAVAYSTFFGSLEALELYIGAGYINGDDKDLLLNYVKVIRNRFKDI